MTLLNIASERPYDVIIERDSLEKIGTLVVKYSDTKKIAVISDDNVARLYAETVLSSLKKNGIDAFLFCIPFGETSKNINTVSSVLEFFSKIGLGRSDAVISLGGGVVGDVAGFAASIYMRGIKLFQIPTTLLSQIDSSIGGKNGVNLKNGKNLCGTFWQPSFVLIDASLLSTLPKKYFIDGLSEVVKCAMIADKELFDMLETQKINDILDDIIFRCVNIKKAFVEADERESGQRMALNFGHTFGHAIERYSDYQLSHGQAVALGMLIICSFDEDKTVFERLKSLLKKLGLPCNTDYSVKYLFEYMKNDKKRRDDFISLVFVKEIGSYSIESTEFSELVNLLGEQ